jgi:hypothetical protein
MVSTSPPQLNPWLALVEAFLPGLGARVNPTKTILQPVDRGVDFVGHVITCRYRVIDSVRPTCRWCPWCQQPVSETSRSAISARKPVAVGMAVTCHPPHRSVRAELPHTAPALGA